MAKYKVRDGFVAHVKQSNGAVFPYEGGAEVDLTDEQYELHAHQVEPVTKEKKPKPDGEEKP